MYLDFFIFLKATTGGKAFQNFFTVGAHKAMALQVGGPSGEIVRVDRESNRKITFEDLPTGGSMMIYGQERDLFAVAKNYIDFFVDKSCGNCTPCRSGNVILKQQFEKIVEKKAHQNDVPQLIKWSKMISQSSRCGLGMTSPRIFIQLQAKFPELFQSLNLADGLHYSFDLDAATSDYDQMFEERK